MKIINSDFNAVDIGRSVDLFVVDPPYGGIVSDQYDQVDEETLFCSLIGLLRWMSLFSRFGTSAYVFGGTGKPGNRPFIRFAYELEKKTDWRIHNWLTWAKRRGYGAQKNWMYTREEILFLVYQSKQPSYFRPQYTKEKRSKEWLKRLETKKYKPRTNNIRYSNVITDINELFRDKIVTAEKPVQLYKLLLAASCPNGGFVVDPMCGSGTILEACKDSNRGLDCVGIERDVKTYLKAVRRCEKAGLLLA